MKIDRTKLKKSNSEVPADCRWLIEKLQTCSDEELLEVLRGFHSWSFGKCELYHWTFVLDRFDGILEQAATRQQPSSGELQESWVLHCDLPENAQEQKLVVWLLHFTTLLVEHSFSRHLYSSVDHLNSLLASSSMRVVLAVLNLLYMFSKRSNFIARLAAGPRQTLLARLMHLAESWGGKENGFDLARCCQNLPLECYPASATTLHFEALARDASVSGDGGKLPAPTVAVQIPALHKRAAINTPSQIMDEILQLHNIPKDSQMAVFTHLRLACHFGQHETRLQCVQARLQALSVLVYCNALQDNANTLLYSGLLDEFVAVLELKEPGLTEIKAATLRTLTSIIHLERLPYFPKLSTIMDVTGASSYHGFLPVLVRSCIASLTSPTNTNGSSSSSEAEQPFPAPLATALFSFLYHLASYEAGGEALVACGMMEALLSVVNWRTTEPDHITFVTRAVRVIDLITNLDMQAFQAHGGLSAFINRLELEVNECRKEQPFVINPPNAPEEVPPSPQPMDTDASMEQGNVEAIHSVASTSSVSPPDASTLNLGPDEEEKEDPAAAGAAGGAFSAAGGTSNAADGTSDAADGASNADNGASNADNGASNGASNAVEGASNTADEASNAADGASNAADGASKAAPGTSIADDGTSDAAEAHADTSATGVAGLNLDSSPVVGDSATISYPDYSAAKTNLTCLAQRAALLKSMLNFLKKAIQDPAFSDSMRHLMEASLPSSLRHIISNAEYYGPSLFLLATDVVTVYVFGEPSFLSSLQDNGLTNVVLHALLIKDVPATREVLSSLPNVFSALCLNSRGLQAFVACRPFEKLFQVLLSPDYLLAMRRRRSADPMGDTASNLGNAMDELMRHQPSLKTVAMKAIVLLLKELCHLGNDKSFVCWKTPPKNEPSPAPSSRSLERETNDNSSDEEEYDEEEREVVTENVEGNDAVDVSVSAVSAAAADVSVVSSDVAGSSGSNCSQEKRGDISNTSDEKKPVPLVDYILNVMKFVDAILSNNATDDHCKEFVLQKGLAPLLEILGLPNLPLDFPSSNACVAVGSVCKSILNLAHESGVVKCGLECVEQKLQTLAPFNMNRSNDSMLLLEVRMAVEACGSEALNSPADPLLNAQRTPLVHTLTAVHAYCTMLVHVCRTSQTDIRQLSVSQWGSDVGLRVLSGLALLYQTLVWETTILINTIADLEKTAASDASKDGSGIEPMDTESSDASAAAAAAAACELQLKLSRQLLASASRLGKVLAELFTLLVKLCVGSPLRQRRGQSLPPTPASPSVSARTVAESLASLLQSLLHWPPSTPESGESTAVAALPSNTGLDKLQLTFMICSLRFTSPMLFDDKKMPYHLLLHYFFQCHGLTAFFESFEWALEAADAHFKSAGREKSAGKKDEVGDTLLEYLESWCALLERLVNPRHMLESPHALPPKVYPLGCLSFNPLSFLMHIQKVAFKAVLKIWERSCVTSYSLNLTELVLGVLCSILKAELVISERLSKEKQSSPSTGGALGNLGSDLVMVASAPSTHIPASVVTTTTNTAAASAQLPEASSSSSGVAESSYSDGPLRPAAALIASLISSATTEAGVSAGGADNTSTTIIVPPPVSAGSLAAGALRPDEDDEDDDEDDLEAENNRQRMRALVDMGFPERRVMRAIAETSTLEQATEFLLMSPATDHLALGILGSLDRDAPDAELSEDAQMLRAIAMSLQEDLTPATDGTTPSTSTAAPNDTADPASTSAASEATQPSSSGTTPSSRSKIPVGRAQLFEAPLKKEELDAFTDNLLEGCLRQLDAQGEIVYKVCDLLTTCSKRNGPKWLEKMLKTLVEEISCEALELQRMASSAACYDDVRQLWASPLANKFAMRLHLMTLLLEEVRHTCTQHITCDELINHLTLLLCDTEAAMSSYSRTAGTAGAAEEECKEKPQQESTQTSSATSVSVLLMPLNLASLDIPERNTSVNKTTQSTTPKWIAPALLFIDLYEKIFVAARKRMALLKKHKRVWKCFDINSHKWVAYTAANNKIIDDAYFAGESSVRIINARRKYLIQFASLVQISEESGNRRPVMVSWDDDVNKTGSAKASSTNIAGTASSSTATATTTGGAVGGSDITSSPAELPAAEPTGTGVLSGPLFLTMEQQFLDFMQGSGEWGPSERSTQHLLPPPPPSSHGGDLTSPTADPMSEITSKMPEAQEMMDMDEESKESEADIVDELPDNISESLIRVCVGLLKHGVDTDTLHAVLRLSLRLTRVWSRAAQFARLGGIKALLECSDALAFKGFYNLAALLMRHVLEEPRTLKHAMEKAIRGTVGSSSSAPGVGGSSSGRELHHLLRLLAPASCRSHDMMTSLAQEMLRISSTVPQISRPVLHQPNNDEVIICQISPTYKSSTASSSANESSAEAQQVIHDLLDALTISGDEDMSSCSDQSSPADAACVVNGPPDTVNGAAETGTSARRQLDLSRSSSVNDMVVQDVDDASPMESETSKLPNVPKPTNKGKRRLLSRWSICKLLAEFVRCYSDVAKLVTEHVYSPETTENISHECSALAYMLDWFVSGSSNSPTTTDDGRGYVKLLVGALASCNHAPECQAVLVSEVKSALYRACQAPESSAKHDQVQALVNLLCTMMETCPPHYSSANSVFAKTNVGMNNMLKILVRKGVITDLARLPHCLDLSSPHLAGTINAALKALEIVARVMNTVALVPSAAVRRKNNQATSSAAANAQERADGAVTASAATADAGESNASSNPTAGDPIQSSRDHEQAEEEEEEEEGGEEEEEEEQTLHAEEDVEQHEGPAGDLDAILSRIIDNRRRETESGGEGGEDDNGDDDDDDGDRNNALATLTFVISDQPMDTEDDTLHDSRMVTHSESQFLEDHEETNDDHDSSSSSSDSSDDDDDDDDNDDDGDNEDNEDVVHDENHADGDDEDEDMDDGSVIDEEEEEEDEEEEEGEPVLFDDSFLRMSGGDRDSEDMVLVPTYQHYIDTIDTIDHMIFGNRLTIPQHGSSFGLHDDQGFMALSTASSSTGAGGGNSAIPAHPLLQNPRDGGAAAAGAAASSSGGAGGSLPGGGAGGSGGRGSQARGGRSRGVLRYSHTPRVTHSANSALLQRLLGRNPSDVLELSSSLRDTTQVWFTNQDVRIFQPDTDPLLSQNTSVLGGGCNSLSNIPSSMARWTEEARVLHSDAVHDTIMRVKGPLLSVLETRRAAEQAERDRKKKEQEAASEPSSLPALLSSRSMSDQPSSKLVSNVQDGGSVTDDLQNSTPETADVSHSALPPAPTTPPVPAGGTFEESIASFATASSESSHEPTAAPTDLSIASSSHPSRSIVTSESPVTSIAPASIEPPTSLHNLLSDADASSDALRLTPGMIISSATPAAEDNRSRSAVSTSATEDYGSSASITNTANSVDTLFSLSSTSAAIVPSETIPPVPPLPQLSPSREQSLSYTDYESAQSSEPPSLSHVETQREDTDATGEDVPTSVDAPDVLHTSASNIDAGNAAQGTTAAETVQQQPDASALPEAMAVSPASSPMLQAINAVSESLSSLAAATESSSSTTPAAVANPGVIHARDTEFADILGDIEIPEGVDPSFLAALPEDMRQEVISEHLRLLRARNRANEAPGSRPPAGEGAPQEATGEVNPEFLAALPPSIQEEVLAQQRVQQAASARHNPDEPVDAAQFLEALPPSLRQTILTDLDNSQFSALPPDLAQEAQTLRRLREAQTLRSHHRLQRESAMGSHTLSHILRNTARLGSRIMQSGSWSTSWNLQPSSSSTGPHAALASKNRGRQLLDHEALSCLLVLLFLDEAKLNTARLHRVLKHLCSHAPTRRWVLATLLSIIETCEEMPQPRTLHPPASIQELSAAGEVLPSTPDHSKGAIKKTSKSTVLTSTPLARDAKASTSQDMASSSRSPSSASTDDPLSRTPGNLQELSSSKTSSSSSPAWLSMSIDAALGCRANVFQIQRPMQLGKKSSSSLPTTVSVSIHPQASPLVCKHTLDALISLAKTFPAHFLPYRKHADATVKTPGASGKGETVDDATASKSGPKAPYSTDFWELLVKLDTINVCKKGKGLARSHSTTGGSACGTEDDNEPLSLEQSPLGLLLEQLAHPVIRRSALLTDKLLRLLALVSAGLVPLPSSSLQNKQKYPQENMDALQRLFSLAIQVLTSKSCSEEGLEDATCILVNLSQCSPSSRSLVLRLLLQGASMLGRTVAVHINALLEDLRAHVASALPASLEHHQDTSSRGTLRDRFTQEEVVIVGQSGSRSKAPSAGSELQLASMPALTSKTSSQAFFLRTLKVIVQLRDAAARRLNSVNTRTAATRVDDHSGSGAGVPDVGAGNAGGVPRDSSSSTTNANTAAEITGANAASSSGVNAAEGGTSSETSAPAVSVTENISQPQQEASQQQESMDVQQSDEPSTRPLSTASPTAEEHPVAEASSEEMDVDQGEEEMKLQSLSQALQLDELWQALSKCLDELAESPDSHAVLVLQPAVEAFFLVHATKATAQPTTASPRSAQLAESRESQLAHLNDLAPMSPLPPVPSPAAAATNDDGESSSNSLGALSTLSDSEKFLKFAERHRSVLNQILRQCTVHLADGPFSVLVDHIRLLDFDIKRKYFRTELERADDGVRREDLTVHVRRDHVFEDSFRELHRRSSDDWKNRFYIVFEGEEGQDAGGLLREWYMIISREIFNPMYALFCISPGDRVTYMINSSSHCNSNHLSYFKFVGRVIAKAVYDNKLLECYFTRSFYKHILGKMVRFTDMESEDYSFYQGLVYLMENDVNTLGYELTFSTEVQEFGVTEVRELKPNGEKIPVTEENKMEYIKLVCQMKMTGAIRKQLNAFLEGFYDIIPKRLISIFNEQELELLISGLPNIDIDDLRANTEYHKYQPNSLQIQWFWRALRGFDQAERAKFLQFVTGTSKVPLQGFAALEGMNGIQKFQIHRDDRATDRLPSAHTCFNQLDLPVYETYDKLRHYLLKAVHECSEGFGFA
ncbi:E3 ubiquitin-protein ligase HUWE1 isoform X2 [Hyalella azteca]|uniref:HECT-type E3 ubiquitin transferase n=1 Tax=Hyalella azteca TaxID=294128 RepID=A0A979FJF7_HYAAZ|nr:E3 ubiquitin-protein ligase HUWE1 isoform X2 [Hyalella azteca]